MYRSPLRVGARVRVRVRGWGFRSMGSARGKAIFIYIINKEVGVRFVGLEWPSWGAYE